MDEHAGIARDGDGLRQGLEKVLDLQDRALNIEVRGSRMFNPGWHMARDDLFMLTVAEAVIRAALARTESRGAHWRTDYPDLSEELGNVNFIVCKTPSGMRVEGQRIPPMPAELADLLVESS
jgi:succinate dehydrogenase / fumarate reductase flavoprotein subunit